MHEGGRVEMTMGLGGRAELAAGADPGGRMVWLVLGLRWGLGVAVAVSRRMVWLGMMRVGARRKRRSSLGHRQSGAGTRSGQLHLTVPRGTRPLRQRLAERAARGPARLLMLSPVPRLPQCQLSSTRGCTWALEPAIDRAVTFGRARCWLHHLAARRREHIDVVGC